LLRLRPKLTYSNVVSTICLFLLLGGGAAIAAGKLGKNTGGTKQLRKNAVTATKIKKGAVTGPKVAPNSITGAQIKASTLGTVPTAANATNAATLGGLGPGGYLGSEHLISGHADLDTPGDHTVLDDPRTGLRISFLASSGLRLINTTGDTLSVQGMGIDASASEPEALRDQIGPGDDAPLSFNANEMDYATFFVMRLSDGAPSSQVSCTRDEGQIVCVSIG
jgi:hypothetical protein